MKTTIDKAGRVVIPAPIRVRAGWKPGSELEVTYDDVSVRLDRKVPRPKIVRVRNRLVARPTAPRKERREIDIASIIEEERNRWPW